MNYAGSIRKHGKWWLLGTLIFLIAASLRWVRLDAISEQIFDEVHYVPAAEVLVGLKPHPGMGAWSFHALIGKAPAPNFEHPLLGKFLIGFSMLMFGDNAWGWRFFPALFGCIGLGLMAALAAGFFQKPGWTLFALSLLAFDSLHILHSRIAMLDIFLAAAMMALLLSSYTLIQAPERWGPRIGSGLALAAGMSIKWVFAFAVIGFCWSLLALGRGSWKLRWQTLVVTGAIALGLYHLWFFYYAAHGFSYGEWIAFHIAANSVTTGQLAAHPYGASALSMLMNSRNIWYYFKQLPGSVMVGLVGLMNPILIFSTLPALAVLIWNYRRSRAVQDAFILGWFLCVYGPFHLVLLKRQGFIYYMLLVQPIIILAVTRAWVILTESRLRPRWTLAWLVPFAVAVLFFMPVTLAWPMPYDLYLWVIKFTGV